MIVSLISDQAMLLFSLAAAILFLIRGMQRKRLVTAYGVLPFAMLSLYYALLIWGVVGQDALNLRIILFRPAQITLYAWVLVAIPNGKINEGLTRGYRWMQNRLSF